MTMIELLLGTNALGVLYLIWHVHHGRKQQIAHDRTAQQDQQQKLYQGFMTHLNDQQQQQGKQSQNWLKQLIDTLSQLKDSQQTNNQQLNTHIQKKLHDNSQQLNQQLHQLSTLMEKRFTNHQRASGTKITARI